MGLFDKINSKFGLWKHTLLRDMAVVAVKKGESKTTTVEDVIAEVCSKLDISTLALKHAVKNVKEIPTYYPAKGADKRFYIWSLVRVLFEPHQFDENFNELSHPDQVAYIRQIADKLSISQDEVDIAISAHFGSILPNN